MEKKAYIAGVIFLALLLIGVNFLLKTEGEVKLTSSDNGSELKINKGQNLVISLEANPSTGYTWDNTNPLDNVIRQVGEIEFKPESDLIGAGGVQIIRFEIINTGRTDLKLIYHRPWEKDVAPLKTFSLKVVVS